MSQKITENVTWVGKIDWQLRSFHGNELSTQRGSSYNSYLLHGNNKTVLIDTVWQPFGAEFVAGLKEVTDLNKIDAIVMNHNEIDHSGALPELMREIPGTPIYCTANGEKILRGHYHQDWNYHVVKTGDKLELGDGSLTFIEAPMLHWPDTMFCYYDTDRILFSNDGFGQHFASQSLTDVDADHDELMHEALKYFANILAPFCPMVTRKVNEILALNLPLDMICPSHGVIWTRKPFEIVEKYLQWADTYQEKRVVIIYDTMWNSTRIMAEEIANGISAERPDYKIKVYNVAHEDKNELLTEMFRAKAILAGSPTVNQGITYAMAGLLEMAQGLKFRDKIGAAFGSYGWNCSAVSQMNVWLQKCGIEPVDDGIKVMWMPDRQQRLICRQYGRDFAKKL